jgi:hypothetical protein
LRDRVGKMVGGIYEIYLDPAGRINTIKKYC